MHPGVIVASLLVVDQSDRLMTASVLVLVQYGCANPGNRSRAPNASTSLDSRVPTLVRMLRPWVPHGRRPSSAFQQQGPSALVWDDGRQAPG